MHSSISSSEIGTVGAAALSSSARPVSVVIALLIVLASVLEVTGRIGFVRVSRIQRRIDAEYQAAIRLRPIVDGKPTLLAVGNSLMLDGLEMQVFGDEVAAVYRPTRFFVEQTEYLDWYYGLRRLFRAGARPGVVLLGLSHNHLVSNRVRGEYFARFLMDTRDFPAVARQEKLDLTTASTWLFANLSGWFGGRAEIRNWLLVRTIPDLDTFGGLLQTPGPDPPDAATLTRSANERLPLLKQLCAENGARFIFVILPSRDLRDPYEATLQAGIHNGVTVLIPFLPGEMAAQGYLPDGYHLNPQGAGMFTHRVGQMLRQNH